MIQKQQEKKATVLAYLAATKKIRYKYANLPPVKERLIVFSIVDKVNKLYDTSLTPETTDTRL